MPKLVKIVVQNFRNIELQELSFSPNINCITGGNGEGKTNLLDAIWYLSMTRSAIVSSDRFNFRHGTKSFAISGLYEMENGTKEKVSISVSREDTGNSKAEKKIRHGEKACQRASSHIGMLPIVMVSPSDTAMVSESGDERRRFTNAVLSQMDREYLAGLQEYNRILEQRNSLLRSGICDETLMDTFEEKMESCAIPLYEKRKAFTESLVPSVREFYEKISGGREKVGIEYRSSLSEGSFKDELKARRAQDLALKYTTTGIHRDDFIFTMDGYPIRRCGSQGQQKSFLVALKFAQYEIMKERYGFSPILLLDDLFDKLDMGRVANLLSMVAGNGFGQIFLSDSNKVRTEGIVDEITSDRTYYEAEGGVFTRMDE